VKPIRWMRRSRQDLKAFPEDARSVIGHGLHLVQLGERPNNERPLHGELSSLTEIRADSANGNTYRSVFTIKLDPFLYVLHCFEKKAKTGIATPKRELDLIRRRLKEAKEEYRDYQKDQDQDR
jgi:phage-related protein